jgi:DNA polymerase III subunit delta'
MVEMFSSIRGQERAVALLVRCLDAGKVPQGLLFFGEEGIGKEKTARAFVAALLCRDRGRDGACGRCAECRLASSGNHPNILHIVPGTHFIRIEEIRRLQEELALKAFSDRPRAVLLLPADRMTLQAANALLKTLEEPPPETHLVLVAHRLSQVPSTIASRCQKIPFAPLSRNDLAAVLRSRPGPPERRSAEEIRAAAACSGGSPGRALAFLEEAGSDRTAWLGLLAAPGPKAVFAASEAWKGAGDRWTGTAVLLGLLRDMALLSSGAKADIMNDDLRDALAASARRKTPSGWTKALGSLLAMTRMPPQIQRRLLLEAFLLALHGKD